MRRKTAILSSLLVCAILIAGGTAARIQRLGAGQAIPPPVAPPTVSVVAGTVASGNVPIYLRGIGYVQAYNTVVVRSQIQGQITQIDFTEGQTAHAGDLLAQIDPRPYQAQLDQASANRQRDQAQLANAQANLQRYLPLLAKGFATPQLVDTQKAQVAQLVAAVKSDEAVIGSVEVSLGYTRITSPIDGVTGIRQIDIGNIIHPTDPNGLVMVTQLQPISVIFTLPEADLPQIQQQMAKGALTVLAFSQDDKIRLDQGTVQLVDNQINQTTGTVRLKATFPNAAHRLWPGELVNMRLLLETRPDGLTVAAPVVQQGPQGTYAYVIKPDQTVDIRPVTVAQISGGQALIGSGLSAGEQVVVDGQARLQPGSHVTILRGKAAQEAAGQSALQAEIP